MRCQVGSIFDPDRFWCFAFMMGSCFAFAFSGVLGSSQQLHEVCKIAVSSQSRLFVEPEGCQFVVGPSKSQLLLHLFKLSSSLWLIGISLKLVDIQYFQGFGSSTDILSRYWSSFGWQLFYRDIHVEFL